MNQTINCEEHGDFSLGYCVCIHVFEKKASTATIEKATTEELGTVLCAACSKKQLEAISMNDLKLVCEGCCKENGFLERIQ